MREKELIHYIEEKRKLFSKAMKYLQGWDGASCIPADEVERMYDLEQGERRMRERYDNLVDVIRYVLPSEIVDRISHELQERGEIL